MAKAMPRNPRDPNPEFVTAPSLRGRGIVYGWRADKHGILAYGNTKAEAVRLWRESYMGEYFDGVTA